MSRLRQSLAAEMLSSDELERRQVHPLSQTSPKQHIRVLPECEPLCLRELVVEEHHAFTELKVNLLLHR